MPRNLSDDCSPGAPVPGTVFAGAADYSVNQPLREEMLVRHTARIGSGVDLRLRLGDILIM